MRDRLVFMRFSCLVALVRHMFSIAERPPRDWRNFNAPRLFGARIKSGFDIDFAVTVEIGAEAFKTTGEPDCIKHVFSG